MKKSNIDQSCSKRDSESMSSTSIIDDRLQAEAAYRWGITPSASDKQESDPAKMPPDHPVHNIPQDKQEKMRQKGINPVLKAEMDELTNGSGKERGFWSKVALNFTGQWRK